MTSTTPSKSHLHRDGSSGLRQRRAVRSTVPARHVAINHRPVAAATAAELHAHYAGRQSSEPFLDAVIARVLGRKEKAATSHEQLWARLLRIADERRDHLPSIALVATAANLVAIATIDDPEDYAATATLVDVLSGPELARLQHRASLVLEDDPQLPATTGIIRQLFGRHLPDRLAADPVTADAAAEIVDACAGVAQALIFEDIDMDRVGPPIQSPAELMAMADRGSIRDWRLVLGMVAAAPWGPYAEQLITFARNADRPFSERAIVEVLTFCREWSKDHERDEIAREIKRLVALSGLSQREFAARIGTSPSRLSTYVSGVVTPSAAMMLRIQRAVRTLRQQTVVPRLA